MRISLFSFVGKFREILIFLKHVGYFRDRPLEINEIDLNFIPLLTLNTYSLSLEDNDYSGYLKGKRKTINEEYRNLGTDKIALAYTIKSELILKGKNLDDSLFHFIAKIPTSQ